MTQTVQDKPWLIQLGVVLWVSFLWASIATMLFFATFDPVELVKVATFPLEVDRLSVYSVGFILFWLLLILNSLAVNWLSPKNNQLKFQQRR